MAEETKTIDTNNPDEIANLLLRASEILNSKTFGVWSAEFREIVKLASSSPELQEILNRKQWKSSKWLSVINAGLQLFPATATLARQHWGKTLVTLVIMLVGGGGFSFWPQVREFLRATPVLGSLVEPPALPDNDAPASFRTQVYFGPPNTRVHVMPVLPGRTVTIDGQFDDWDLSGQFQAALAGSLGPSYFFDGAMMYDANNLYLSARVGDPFPLKNPLTALKASEAETEPVPWKGGALYVYIALGTNDSLKAERFSTNPRFVKLALWCHQAEGEKPVPCLMISHTMKDGGRTKSGEFRVLREGFEASCRKEDSGPPGYLLEYRIPWEQIKQDAGTEAAVPASGWVSRCCWDLHWSDEKGENFRGKLVDIVNPENEFLAYEDPNAWGLALYH